jgi:hypothetical protein
VVQCHSNTSQRQAAPAQLVDFREHGLFAGIWLDVFPVGAQAVAELDVPNSLTVSALVAQRIARPFADGLALPHGLPRS